MLFEQLFQFVVIHQPLEIIIYDSLLQIHRLVSRIVIIAWGLRCIMVVLDAIMHHMVQGYAKLSRFLLDFAPTNIRISHHSEG